MTTERHVTLVEADVSQYMAAQARMQAAQEAQAAAAKKLAAALEEGERERISAMRASHDAATRAAVGRRLDALEARREMAAAREDMATARRQIAEQAAAEREAAAASKRAAAEREAAYRRIAAQDQRMADQREAAYRREADMIERVAAARDSAYARAERGAATYTALLAKQRDAEARSAAMPGAIATGARTAGAVGAGIGIAAAGVNMAIDKTSELVDESFKAQAVSRNLQLDIRAARSEMSGLVSDYDLAFAANKAYAMKVVTTGDEFAHLAGMIGEQATKLGRDAGELINEGVEAIGKQESEIADNLGVTMRLTDAYALYAEQLDKSVSSLTAKEKAEAFNKAMIIALEQATGRATVGVEGFAAAWKKAGVEYENFRGRFMGFEDMHGRAAEALRELSDEQLDRLKFADALNDEDAKRADAMGKTAREMQGHISQWGLSIMDLKEHADTMGVSYLQMLDDAKAAHAQMFEASKDETLKIAQAETLQIMEDEADALDQSAALLKIMGGTEREVLEAELQVLEARQMAALTQAAMTKDAKDEAAAKKITFQIEQTHAKIEMIGKKKGGAKRDPNEALDLETAATLRLLNAREKIYEAEVDGERSLSSVADTRRYLLTLEREELDVREKAADQRKVSKAKDVAALEAERLEILTERRLLDVQAMELEREESRRLAEERIAAMDRNIERLAAEGVAVQLLQQRRTDAHVAMVAEFGTTEELRDAEHERTIERIESERAYEVSHAEAKLEAFTIESEIASARGAQIYDLTSRRLELEAQIAAAEGDHDLQRQVMHQREVARIEERRAKMQRATQATSSMLSQGMGLFSAITDATIKDEAKREKATLRARGVEAVARGALETVEAVAAFASFNYIQGALHIAAAATAFATGIPMIAGKVPSKADASAGGGGGAGHQTVVSDTGSSGGMGSSSSGPGVPVSAEELIRMRQGSSGTVHTTSTKGEGATIINFNAPIISGDAGTLIRDTAKGEVKKWGAK